MQLGQETNPRGQQTDVHHFSGQTKEWDKLRWIDGAAKENTEENDQTKASFNAKQY